MDLDSIFFLTSYNKPNFFCKVVIKIVLLLKYYENRMTKTHIIFSVIVMKMRKQIENINFPKLSLKTQKKFSKTIHFNFQLLLSLAPYLDIKKRKK